MAADDHEPTDRQNVPSGPDDAPEVEDAYTPDEPVEEHPLEDEPELLDSTLRSLESEPEALDEWVEPVASARLAEELHEKEDAGDTDSIPDDPEIESPATPIEWGREVSARRVAVELKRVETQIRGLLNGRDSRRKRKLTGTRRWLELEEDIISWRFSSRFDEEGLAQLRQLVTRRHYLFKRLRFLADTRATWNT